MIKTHKHQGSIILFLCLLLIIVYMVKPEEKEKEPYHIICITKAVDSSNGFWNAMSEGFKMAADEYDVKVEINGPDWEGDIETQNRMILEAIERKPKPDAIVLAAADYEKTLPAAKKVKENGIKLILVDSGVKEHIEDTIIATDNVKAGIRVGAVVKEALDEDGKVAVVSHVKNSATAIDRENGVRVGLSDDADRIVDVFYCDSDFDKAYNHVVKLLEGDLGITVIAGLNQYSAEGAAAAVKDLNLKNKVKVVGFDNSTRQIQYLEEGIYEGLVVQKAFNMGYLGIEKAVKLLNGENVAKQYDSGSILITKDNMYIGLHQKLLFPFWEE